MKIFAISDLHLSNVNSKPMDIFGAKWVDYIDKIKADWTAKVQSDDIVLIGGDISWAMDLPDALVDIFSLEDLPGKKVLFLLWQGYAEPPTQLHFCHLAGVSS